MHRIYEILKYSKEQQQFRDRQIDFYHTPACKTMLWKNSPHFIYDVILFKFTNRWYVGHLGIRQFPLHFLPVLTCDSSSRSPSLFDSSFSRNCRSPSLQVKASCNSFFSRCSVFTFCRISPLNHFILLCRSEDSIVKNASIEWIENWLNCENSLNPNIFMNKC